MKAIGRELSWRISRELATALNSNSNPTNHKRPPIISFKMLYHHGVNALASLPVFAIFCDSRRNACTTGGSDCEMAERMVIPDATASWDPARLTGRRLPPPPPPPPYDS